MGWFWDSKGDDPTNDPYKKLDPTLRDFLDKESPLKHEDTKPKPTPKQPPPPSPDGAPNTFRSQLGLDTLGPDQQNQDVVRSHDRPVVPAESRFQDGRYAHLWKNYRPQSEVEAAGKTDQDRLASVIEAYNDRKAAIGRAALENCVEYQLAEKDCFSNGGWAKRMTMCRDESKAFNRCYTMQSRFLKALGYLASQRTEEEDERIQMHADKLYGEMLHREQVQQEAKEAGQEIPQLPPLIQPESTMKALGQDSAWARARKTALERGLPTNLSAFSPEKQAQIKERIKGLPKEEQDLELQLIAGESRAQFEYADKIAQELEEEKAHRADRRERGKETFGDTIKRLWGWDK